MADGSGHPFVRSLDRAIDVAAVVATWLAGGALLSAFGLILVEVILRNLFNATSVISVEYSIYLLVALTFFGLIQTQREGAMIYMELVYQRLSPRAQAWADAVRHVIALIYGIIVVWFVTRFTANTCSLNQLSSYSTMTPLCIPQSVMSVGLALLCLEWARGVVRSVCAVVRAAPPAGREE